MLKDLLGKEIEDTLQRIQLGAHVSRDTTTPLTITIGADIECRISQGSEDALTHYKIRAQQNALIGGKDWFSEHATAIGNDHDRVEINLIPGSPTEIIRRWHTLNKHLKDHYAALGYNFRMGPGHWHMSLWRGANALLKTTNDEGRGLSELAQHLAIELVHDQLTLPAVYISPQTAEKRPDFRRRTRRVGAGLKTYTVVADCYREYPARSPFFESRLATQAPELPVLALVSCVERVLSGRSDIDRITTALVDYGFDRPCLIGGSVVIRNKQEVAVHGGAEHYLRLLERTALNPEFDKRFGALALPMLNAMFASYEQFLRKPYNGLYDEPRMAEVMAKVEALRARLMLEPSTAIEAIRPADAKYCVLRGNSVASCSSIT